MTGSSGKDSGGRGASGMAEEKTREARAGETGTTRFGFVDEDSDAKNKADTAQRRHDGNQEGAKK